MSESYREPGLDARKPSRLRAIEELPIALALFKITHGEFREGVLAAVNYGRDSDSIATMLGAISGAMNGRSAIPQEWVETVERESKRDFLLHGLRGFGASIAETARPLANRGPTFAPTNLGAVKTRGAGHRRLRWRRTSRSGTTCLVSFPTR